MSLNEFRYKFGKVAVLYGGISSEHKISSMSGKAVISALKNYNIDVLPINLINKDLLVKQLLYLKATRCFIALHGGCGEDGTIQKLLDKINIPYTGSGHIGCALSMNKLKAKEIWKNKGLLTPKYQIISNDCNNVINLKFPLAIKPVMQGSSIGVYKVSNHQELLSAYHQAIKYGPVMAEEWIEGKELTVAIVNETILPPVLISPKLEFYNYEAKYDNKTSTSYYCPSGMSLFVEQSIKKIAFKAFKMIHCTGWGRVDLILSKNNDIYTIEINSVPGLSELSLLPMAAREYGWNFNMLIIKILETSL